MRIRVKILLNYSISLNPVIIIIDVNGIRAVGKFWGQLLFALSRSIAANAINL